MAEGILMRGLRRRFGRASLGYAEHFVHDHGETLGMALGVGAGALLGGGVGTAGTVAGAAIGAVAGAAVSLATRRRSMSE